ncbi:ATP-binding cassette domain-containing protein [Patulibacter brassicae]|uniref:ATP-binding cassette domain-containing protein n=1 Tax=Patulibacter brassicae TaxID=1705717 RepID=A0ABU4VPD7_9ACTN|nr:ATP-binding cassette domain-containing protein [Patulibacter brassicae]MDX8153726.1 ATP-binding cassette domain-containing protein [Patulibacter brassicae]
MTPELVSRDLPATAIVARLRAALADAVSERSPTVERLAHARTSVAFRVAGAPDAVTLDLGRDPVLVEDGDHAEIVLDLRPQDALAFTDGALALAGSIITGDVGHRGPVREYMEVDPILRELLRRGSGHEGEDARRSSCPARIAPELLAIESRGLQKSFGRNRVLAGLDVQIPEGMISVVLGPSGTGKSVLLQHVLGLLRPDAGEVLIRGRALSGMSRSEIMALRREIGVMFQDGALFSAMNIYDNAAFPLRQHTDLTEPEIEEIVMHHLTSVGLGGAIDRMPNELSGGMRKRAGLARALVLNAGIVLCDEPDSGLDPVRTALLGELLVEQHAEHGGTMVVVTHNIMLARLLADHMTIVWRGRVLESGLAQDVLESDTPFVQQFLAGASEGPLGMDA